MYQCIKCRKEYDQVSTTGCPECLRSGYPSSIKRIEPGLMFGRNLLGEHNTPCVLNEKLTGHFNVSGIYFKNEFQNPTGSHKDRMSSEFVQYAASVHAKGVVIASSGNAGISLAMYANYMNIPSVVITDEQVTRPFKTALRAIDVDHVAVKQSSDRWPLLKTYVDRGYLPATNYVTPPVGSHPAGVTGYRKIAHELADVCPTHVIVPVSRGDLLYGIYDGFSELDIPMPKFIAIEPFRRLEKVLDGAEYTATFKGDDSRLQSIGGNTVTYQSLKAIQDSGGRVISLAYSSDVKACSEYGMYLEASSSLILRALEKMRPELNQASRIVSIVTSHGFKNEVSDE
ncbi:MAG: PLP-dependent lyase/thiolase [Desulfobacterales bacterium]|nr:PLP-dependent lyase/thiolase [Desulfobacterales bacterium]